MNAHVVGRCWCGFTHTADEVLEPEGVATDDGWSGDPTDCFYPLEREA